MGDACHDLCQCKLALVQRMGEGGTDLREALDGYEVVNVALLFQGIGVDGLELQLTVNNLLDEEYADPAPENTIFFDFPVRASQRCWN
jgi:outer membrane receptor protein involved in Fe transport